MGSTITDADASCLSISSPMLAPAGRERSWQTVRKPCRVARLRCFFNSWQCGASASAEARKSMTGSAGDIGSSCVKYFVSMQSILPQKVKQCSRRWRVSAKHTRLVKALSHLHLRVRQTPQHTLAGRTYDAHLSPFCGDLP